MKKEHESYGMINISKFTGNNSQFFGSDLTHGGGVSITISKADVDRKYHREWFHSGEELIRVRLSASQYVDAITSGMNTQGVPCTIERYENKRVEQIDHVINKKEQFNNEMIDTQQEYISKIDSIIQELDGAIGKRKVSEIKNDLDTLKRHLLSNTNFVLKCFNEAMEDTVTEAKHSISNYIDHKVHTMGIEGLKEQLKISIENK